MRAAAQILGGDDALLLARQRIESDSRKPAPDQSVGDEQILARRSLFRLRLAFPQQRSVAGRKRREFFRSGQKEGFSMRDESAAAQVGRFGAPEFLACLQRQANRFVPRVIKDPAASGGEIIRRDFSGGMAPDDLAGFGIDTEQPVALLRRFQAAPLGRVAAQVSRADDQRAVAEQQFVRASGILADAQRFAAGGVEDRDRRLVAHRHEKPVARRRHPALQRSRKFRALAVERRPVLARQLVLFPFGPAPELDRALPEFHSVECVAGHQCPGFRQPLVHDARRALVEDVENPALGRDHRHHAGIDFVAAQP
ncbi:MAG: hypothetical protein BWZ10_02624 [candidate division BRC1 bacterium ADurb.BinA364]|nr:MAG: hypothetical protein BWZ10_02624 [candidate division BRC1 bacterium ADurb.BinA364]